MKISLLFNSVTVQLFRHEKIVYGVIALVILVSGFALFLNPIIKDIREVGILDFTRESSQLTQRQAYESRLRTSLEQYRAIRDQAQLAVSQVLPKTQDLPALFVFLDDLVRQSGMTLSSVTFTPGSLPTSPPGVSLSQNIRALNIQMTATPNTSYDQVKTLLQNIELSQRIFDVVSLNFSTTASGETASSNGISLTVRTYYFVQD